MTFVLMMNETNVKLKSHIRNRDASNECELYLSRMFAHDARYRVYDYSDELHVVVDRDDAIAMNIAFDVDDYDDDDDEIVVVSYQYE